MKSHDILRRRLLIKAGVISIQPPKRPPLEELRKTEWSSEFEQLMRNRLIMGCFRYGPFNRQNRSTERILASIERCVQSYRETGNDEFLVDIANFAMKEFAVGNHPNKHFKSIDDGAHT